MEGGELGAMAAILGAAFTAASAFAVFMQLYHSNRQKKREFTLQILREYRSKKFKLYERLIKNHLSPELAVSAAKHPGSVFNLGEGKKISITEAITNVSYFYDLAGILVARNAVDVDMLFSDLADDSVICWDRIKPYIDEIRKKRQEDRKSLTKFSVLQYQTHFDYLQQTARRRRLPYLYRSFQPSPRSIPLARALPHEKGIGMENND